MLIDQISYLRYLHYDNCLQACDEGIRSATVLLTAVLRNTWTGGPLHVCGPVHR